MFYKSASLIQTAIFQVKSCHKVAPSWGATLWQRCFLAEYDWEKKGWHKVTPSKVYLRYLQLVSALAMLQLDDKIIHTCTYSIKIFYLKDALLAYRPRGFNCVQDFCFWVQNSAFAVRPSPIIFGGPLSPQRWRCTPQVWLLSLFPGKVVLQSLPQQIRPPWRCFLRNLYCGPSGCCLYLEPRKW